MKIIIGKDVGSYTFDASAGTITISGLPAIKLEDVFLITNVTEGIMLYNFASQVLSGTILGNVITLGYDTSEMSDTDSLQIIVEYGENTVDYTLGAIRIVEENPIRIIEENPIRIIEENPIRIIEENPIRIVEENPIRIVEENPIRIIEESPIKVVEQNPIWNRYIDSELLISARNLTGSYLGFGSLIDMRGFTHLGLFIDIDANDSRDVLMKILGEHEEGSSTNYEINGISEVVLWSGLGTDSHVYYEFDVGAIPFVKVKALAGTVGVTPGDLTINITKIWRP